MTEKTGPSFPEPGLRQEAEAEAENSEWAACVLLALDEIARLSEINHELVCSHNDLLVVLTRMEAGQRDGVCACGNPTRLGVAHRSHECLTIGVQRAE